MNEVRILKMLRNDFSSFLVNPDDYEKEKLIGKGGYAEVWLATDKKTGEQVAFKQLFHSITFKQARSFAREIKTMSYGSHPFFLKFLGFSATSPLVLISEYMPNRSLFRFLKSKHRRVKLKGTHRTLIAMGISHAMWYLHSLGIIHRDLKSMNILLSSDFLPRLCDFGIARFLSNNPDDVMTTRIGTPHWMAPEILNDQKYGFPADVYSFSMLLYEMLTNSIPWAGKDPATILKLVCNDHCRPKFPIKDEEEEEEENNKRKSKISIEQLIQLCWSQSPEERPTFQKIYEMFRTKQVYFNGTNLKKVDELDKKLSLFASKSKIMNNSKNQNLYQTNFDEDDSDDEKTTSASTTSTLTTVTNENDYDESSSYYSNNNNNDDDSFVNEKNQLVSRQKSRNMPIKASKLKAMTAEVIFDDSTKTSDTNSQIIKQDSTFSASYGQGNDNSSRSRSRKSSKLGEYSSYANDRISKKIERKNRINFDKLKNIDDTSTFSEEMKKVPLIISEDQYETFFSIINDYFDEEIDEDSMKLILEAIHSILTQKSIDKQIDSKSSIESNPAIECIVRYDIQQKMCFKSMSLMNLSLDILLILFKNRPTAFQTDFEKQMVYIIKKSATKAIILLSHFAAAYLASQKKAKKWSRHSYSNYWSMLDLLFKRSPDFFRANVGTELISVLFNLCLNSSEFKGKNIESCIEVFQKGTQLDIEKEETISMAYVCLSHFSFEFEDIEFDITNLIYILKNASKPATIRTVLYLLLKLKRIPRKEKKNLIQVLLDRSRTFSEANLCLIRICSKDDGAAILMNDISWISSNLPTLKDTMSLFLTVFYQTENRKFLLKSKHTSALINGLLSSDDNGEIFTIISVLFNSFENLPVELFDSFTRRGVFHEIVEAAIESVLDSDSLKAVVDIMTCVSCEKFNDEFLRLFDLIVKKMVKWPKLIPRILQAFSDLSKYQQCANKIRSLKIDKIIEENFGDDSKYAKMTSKLLSSLR